jgi:hypothetical protein
MSINVFFKHTFNVKRVLQMKLYSQAIVGLSAVFLAFCAKQDTGDALAQIGSTTITKQNYEAFNKVIRIFPSKPNDNFPGQRSPATFMTEVEVLSSKLPADVKSKLFASDDWKWKKIYYPAQFYIFDILAPNLGFTDDELKGFYNSNKNLFVETFKPADTTKKDSTYTKTFDEAKEKIITIMFCERNKPDSAFMNSAYMKSFPKDSMPPQSEIDDSWVSSVRKNPPLFFMKKFYKEDFGKNYPDSIDGIFGDGKLITPKDLDVILSWIPEERRESFSEGSGKKEMVEWLLKWKLFAARAEKSGYLKKNQFYKASLEWAQKIESANAYINKEIIPKLSSVKAPDTSMLLFAYNDDLGSVNLNPDTHEISNRVLSYTQKMKTDQMDSVIYSMRKKASIKYFKDELKDDKSVEPSKIIAKADSLRDSSKSELAEQEYKKLVDNFAFTPEGKRATIELAKLLTERQSYYQAVSNYRNYLLYGDDKSKFCNVFFMIGFIYDEYLDKPDLAELNYKYILKNLKGCDLTDDAEFMMLHLGEPMSSIEELQAEALRQGRKIDADAAAN